MKDTDNKTKILFLCRGNIYRSPMAEFVMKELVRRAGRDDIVVESAALHTDEIGSDIHYGTRRKLQAECIPFAPRRALEEPVIAHQSLIPRTAGAQCRDLV